MGWDLVAAKQTNFISISIDAHRFTFTEADVVLVHIIQIALFQFSV